MCAAPTLEARGTRWLRSTRHARDTGLPFVFIEAHFERGPSELQGCLRIPQPRVTSKPRLYRGVELIVEVWTGTRHSGVDRTIDDRNQLVEHFGCIPRSAVQHHCPVRAIGAMGEVSHGARAASIVCPVETLWSLRGHHTLFPRPQRLAPSMNESAISVNQDSAPVAGCIPDSAVLPSVCSLMAVIATWPVPLEQAQHVILHARCSSKRGLCNKNSVDRAFWR